MTTSSHISWKQLPRARRVPRTENVAIGSPLEGLWVAVLDWIAPVGYEDESGFHFGEKPTELARDAR